MGALYYLPEATGFVEFKDSEIEFTEIDEKEYATTIDKNGFNLKLIAGNLPKFKYDAKTVNANDNEVAISKYLAETILYWAGGNENETFMNIEIMVGSSIFVNNVEYTVTGVYDTGAIPSKYNELKPLPKQTENSLGSDFRTYLSAGLYQTFIVGEGYTDYVISDKKIYTVPKQRIPGYYAQNQEYGIVFENATPYTIKAGHKTGRFYNVDDISIDKIIMFDEERNQDIQLADHEVLISVEYLDDLFSNEQSYAAMNGDAIKQYWYPFNLAYETLIQQAKTTATSKMRNAMKDYIDNLKALIEVTDVPLNNHIKNLQITVSDKYESKFFKVVGVYTGVDTDINNHASPHTLFPIAMTDKGLESIYVNPNQGLYGRIIAPSNTSTTATKYLANRMTADDTRLIWYGNNALTMVNEGGKMVKQFANLFLYAAIILALFSIFMLYNYISASIVAKKQSIGVLRALGSGFKDIVSMFITESLIIAIINAILASCVASVGCVLVNMYIRNVMNLAIDFALYDVRQVILILVASILTAIASSIIPIVKIAKEKPVKLIREP
jgi:ABC-type antimicrobial peptide transport system permease subunit